MKKKYNGKKIFQKKYHYLILLTAVPILLFILIYLFNR